MKERSDFAGPAIEVWLGGVGVGFGTSGVRGPVAALNDRLCCAIVLGFLGHLEAKDEFAAGTRVAIAGDLRPSTRRIVAVATEAIRHAGGVPIHCGEVPTPALCLYAFGESIPSLMVTGSHISADRNGIKFNRAHGEFLKSDEAEMLQQRVDVPADWIDPGGNLLLTNDLPQGVDVTADYVRRYVDFFGRGALAGMRLGVYEHSAVGRDILVRVLEQLGATVQRLGRSAAFVAVDTEALGDDFIANAGDWVRQHSLHALLSTDGDSDRPVLFDESGAWLPGDILGLLAARYLGVRMIATPVNSNSTLERSGIAEVHRTRIGSPHVIAAMAKALREGRKPVAGYEANGGFLLASDIELEGRTLSALPTRDAMLPMLSALAAVRKAGSTLSSLVATLPPRHTRSGKLPDMPIAASEALLAALESSPAILVSGFGAIERIDRTDGMCMILASGDTVHFRPSRNAPELRVYVESESRSRAEELLSEGLSMAGDWIKHHAA